MKQGNESAVEERQDAQTLFRNHAGFVAAFLKRLGAPSSEVEDLVQEVFLVAHRKGGYVKGAGQPKTWLAAIALRVASTNKRSRGRRREDGLGTAADGQRSDLDPQRALEAQRSLQRVQEALDTLDLEHRAAFVLYEIEGASCESIAEAFNVPIGTVYSRLHSARKRFTDAHRALEAPSVRVRARLAEGT